MKSNKTLILILIILAGGLFSSCYLPSPLYGTWSNNGDTLQFFDDFSFSATIKNEDGTNVMYSGMYSVINNVLIFTITEPLSHQMNTDWDIRGAMLYLKWQVESEKKLLTLYHVAR